MTKNDELAAWLLRHGLEGHEPLLRAHEVDFATLGSLTEAELRELGLPIGARKRLLAALRGQPAQAAAAADENARRQITVLFCDVAGYTELAARLDPEPLTAMVKAYEALCLDCVARHHGHPFQRLGDGIVAFFGYPQEHEHDAARAVHAGLDILAGSRRLERPFELRIGIATGIVVVSGGGRRAVGYAMNLAARLQAVAEPGSLVVSATVRKLAGQAFRYAPLGEMVIKGSLAPVAAYRVEARVAEGG